MSDITDQDILDAKSTVRELGQQEFKSRFEHLNNHLGFKRGETHTLIAPTGHGKTTLFRSWVMECIAYKKKTYLRLSEERRQVFIGKLIEYMRDEELYLVKEYLKIDSELDLDIKISPQEYFDNLKYSLVGSDIYFYDNLSTSFLADMSLSQQMFAHRSLRNLASKLHIPIVIAMHSAKQADLDKILGNNDQRGPATLVNQSGYIYTINIAKNHEGTPTVLNSSKIRHKGSLGYFQLNYDKDYTIVVNDMRISKERAKEYFTKKKEKISWS